MLIVEQFFDKNTYMIVYGKDKKIEIPMSKIELMRNRFVQIMDRVATVESLH